MFAAPRFLSHAAWGGAFALSEDSSKQGLFTCDFCSLGMFVLSCFNPLFGFKTLLKRQTQHCSGRCRDVGAAEVGGREHKGDVYRLPRKQCAALFSLTNNQLDVRPV